jgi:RHS repeat-associated protein
VIPGERRDLKAMILLAYEKGADALPPFRVTEYLWDGNALAAEIAPDKSERVFVHEPGTLTPLFQQEQRAVFTYVNDHLGMPKELVDEDGRVAWAAAHSAWGQVVEMWRDPAAKIAVESPFRLLGQYLDDETGLCYTRFRYFDPNAGRWLSPDPLGVEGGKNLFAFDGAPTVEVDPWGLCGERRDIYSVAFEAELEPGDFGKDRRAHFRIANKALEAERASNAALADLVPAPAGRTQAPPGWVWQHATIEQGGGRPGVLQLVPKEQHTPGSPFWRALHPLPGAAGGYHQWAIPAGAPAN